jgi:diamine N-acetyltransferase
MPGEGGARDASSERSSFTIRRARPDDAEVFSELAIRTFHETYGERIPAADVQAYLAEVYAVERQRALLGDAEYGSWLVEENGVPIGLAVAGPCSLPHPDVSPDDGELKRLYLVREHQNGGRGARLFTEVIQWLLREGPRTLWIGVWAGNDGALRFYQRHGFERAGEYQFTVGRVRDLDFILRRRRGA